MRRLERLSIGLQLGLLVVSGLVVLTFSIATIAITLSHSRNDILDEEEALGKTYVAPVRDFITQRSKGATGGEAAASGVLIVMAGVFVAAYSRRLRLRVRQLRDTAGHLADGQLDRPVDTRTDDGFGVLAYSLEHMRESLRESMELAAHKVQLEQEMALTGQLQSHFFPQESTLQAGELHLRAQYVPADRCGGDWWWHEECPDGSLLVIMGDVTGHGAGAALVTGSMCTAIRCARDDGMLSDVPALMHLLNELLRGSTRGRYHMTLSVVRVDPERSTLQWWNAGAPPIMVRRKSGTIDTLTQRGTILGDETVQWGFLEDRMEPGDEVLVFTDGIPETERPGGKQLGLRRVRALLAECSTDNDNAGGGEHELLEAVVKERGDLPQDDDLTLVVVRRSA